MLRPGMNQDEIALDREWVEDKSEYIASLYHRYAEGLLRVQPLQRALFEYRYKNHAYAGDVECEFLYLSMRELQPEIVVEVGSGVTWTTSWLLRGLHDNGHGMLTSCDLRNHVWRMPDELKPYWTFLLGDSRKQTFPSPIDFLLLDSDHQLPYAKDLQDQTFPLVRPGGRICIHDVFAIKTPAHGEAMWTFIHLDKIGKLCYTVAHCFAEQHAVIQEARKAIGLGPIIQINDWNSMLIFEGGGEYETGSDYVPFGQPTL